jgi:TrmH family RNA methyltransferase
MPDGTMADVLASEPRLVLVAVGISEPGNATLIRLADAMGADAVVGRHAVDPLQREVPARLGGKHLLTPRARGHRHR